MVSKKAARVSACMRKREKKDDFHDDDEYNDGDGLLDKTAVALQRIKNYLCAHNPLLKHPPHLPV